MSLCLKSVLGPSLGLWGQLSQLGKFFGLPLPEVAEGIWEAAPKKRTSHQKKRQRQLAGNNQQKPLRNLGRCPACGHFKRAHTLCMNCVKEIQGLWRQKSGQPVGQREGLDPADEAFNYPQRLTRPTEYQEKLDKRDYILRRPRTLPVIEKRGEKVLPQALRKPREE